MLPVKERPFLPRGLFRALGGCGTHRLGRHTPEGGGHLLLPPGHDRLIDR